MDVSLAPVLVPVDRSQYPPFRGTWRDVPQETQGPFGRGARRGGLTAAAHVDQVPLSQDQPSDRFPAFPETELCPLGSSVCTEGRRHVEPSGSSQQCHVMKPRRRSWVVR